jgi:hypothetical protein
VDGARRSRDHGWLLLVVVAVPVVVLWLTYSVGGLTWWTPLPVVLFLAAAVASADSPAELLLVSTLVLAWVKNGDSVHHPATLVVAELLLLLHAALAMRSTGPAEANFDRASWLRWGRRLGVVGVVTAVVWGLSWVLQEGDLSGTAVLMVAALLAAGGCALLLRRLTLPGAGEPALRAEVPARRELIGKLRDRRP